MSESHVTPFYIFESGRGGGGTDDAMSESPVIPCIYLGQVVEEGEYQLQYTSLSAPGATQGA